MSNKHERVLHCWADGPEEYRLNADGIWTCYGSTCLLADGHEGEHEFTPDENIVAEFDDKPLPN